MMEYVTRIDEVWDSKPTFADIKKECEKIGYKDLINRNGYYWIIDGNYEIPITICRYYEDEFDTYYTVEIG